MTLSKHSYLLCSRCVSLASSGKTLLYSTSISVLSQSLLLLLPGWRVTISGTIPLILNIHIAFQLKPLSVFLHHECYCIFCHLHNIIKVEEAINNQAWQKYQLPNRERFRQYLQKYHAHKCWTCVPIRAQQATDGEGKESKSEFWIPMSGRRQILHYTNTHIFYTVISLYENPVLGKSVRQHGSLQHERWNVSNDARYTGWVTVASIVFYESSYKLSDSDKPNKHWDNTVLSRLFDLSRIGIAQA
jgi:hypothetical protein